MKNDMLVWIERIKSLRKTTKALIDGLAVKLKGAFLA